jgi:hypothetical protein
MFKRFRSVVTALFISASEKNVPNLIIPWISVHPWNINETSGEILSKSSHNFSSSPKRTVWEIVALNVPGLLYPTFPASLEFSYRFNSSDSLNYASTKKRDKSLRLRNDVKIQDSPINVWFLGYHSRCQKFGFTSIILRSSWNRVWCHAIWVCANPKHSLT